MVTNLLINLYNWVALSVIVWLAATTLARARVLRPLRAWVKERSDYFGEGVSCQYCISHWVGFAVAIAFRPRFLMMTTGFPALDLFAHALAIIGLAALIARTLGKTPPDGLLHPDEKARREAEARERMDLDRTMEELYPSPASRQS